MTRALSCTNITNAINSSCLKASSKLDEPAFLGFFWKLPNWSNLFFDWSRQYQFYWKHFEKVLYICFIPISFFLDFVVLMLSKQFSYQCLLLNIRYSISVLLYTNHTIFWNHFVVCFQKNRRTGADLLKQSHIS